jgi:heptaprenyl diphosphate synthase
MAAAALFLSTIEYAIPRPLPFMRLGLSNLPLLLGIGLFSPKELLTLWLLKTVGQNLIAGTLASYVFFFSAAGGLASVIVMMALSPLKGRFVSLVGISVAGAFASNLAQMGLAAAFVFGRSAWLLAPPFLALGVATGLAMGLAAAAFAGKSRWYASLAPRESAIGGRP